MPERLLTQRLKKRRDFLLAAKGRRARRTALAVECRARDDGGAPRIGFTVTKRTAKKAVERNRIRRRLREAMRAEAGLSLGCDYVVIGRRAALSAQFRDLKNQLSGAVTELSRRTTAMGNRRERSEPGA